MIVPLHKSKGERIECSNYEGISFLRIVGKIYGGILLGRVRRVTEDLNEDEQGVCVCRSNSTREEIYDYVDFMDLENVYDRVNMEVFVAGTENV